MSVTMRFIAENTLLNSALKTAIDFTTQNTAVNGSWQFFPPVSWKAWNAWMVDLLMSQNLWHSFSTSFSSYVASHSSATLSAKHFYSFMRSSLLLPLQLFLTVNSPDLRLFTKFWKNWPACTVTIPLSLSWRELHKSHFWCCFSIVYFQICLQCLQIHASLKKYLCAPLQGKCPYFLTRVKVQTTLVVHCTWFPCS